MAIKFIRFFELRNSINPRNSINSMNPKNSTFNTLKATATIPALLSKILYFTGPVSVTLNGNVKEPNNVTEGRNGLRNLNRLTYSLLFALCSLLIFIGGCASFQQKEKILAVVDGEYITERDLEYSLTVAHRREDLSSAGTLKLIDYVQKLVDDRLIIDEARRAGMDKYLEVQQAVQAFILRESVVRLHKEEIVQKVKVTDQEILNFYKDNYERFSLCLIEVYSEERAKEIVVKLRQGGDFEELAMKYSNHASRENGGKIVLTKKGVPTYLLEAISHLKAGETSDVINILDKFFIVKFIEKEEAHGGQDFEKHRETIEKNIRKQKEDERSKEYLQDLRGKASIQINEEILSAINFDGEKEEIEKWSKNDSPLVEIDSSILTLGEFISIARPNTRKTKEDILNSWIDRKLVDLEALRHYEREPALKRMIYRYENYLLKDMFIKRVVVPQIVITDEMAEEYYSNNQERFTSPAQYKIQMITVKDPGDAQVILNNLLNGADFSWWARTKSIDASAKKGGDAGWFIKDTLPEPLRDSIDTLEPGDITPIIEANSYYMIVRLKEKIDEKVRAFSDVKYAVRRACFDDQLNSILKDYVAQLKANAEIKFYDENIQSLEEKFLQ